MKKLSRHTLYVSFGLYIRTAIQALTFIIIARILGPENFGSFISILAITTIASPFAGAGYDFAIIKKINKTQKNINLYYYRSLKSVFVTAPPLIIFTALFIINFLPENTHVAAILSLLTSDMLLLRISEMIIRIYQAKEIMERVAHLRIIIVLLRCLGALCLLVLPHQSVDMWCFLYFLSTAMSTLILYILAKKELGSPKSHQYALLPDMFGTFYFAISICSERIISDVDKIMLARMTTLDTTGHYSVAYRLMEMIHLPIIALLASSLSKFFKAGQTGLQSSITFSLTLLPYPCIYASLAGTAFYFLAPYATLLVGVEYVEAVAIAQALSVMPLLITLQRFASLSLDGAGHQKLRSLLQATLAIFNIFLNALLIPMFGVLGAVYATITSEAVMILATWGSVYLLLKKQVNTD